MRELIERFGYRYRLWLAEKRGEHLGAGSNPQDESKGKIVFRHLFLLLFGIMWALVLWQFAYTNLKRGFFPYTPQNGATQIISANTDAAAYWTGIAVTLAAGAVGIVMATYASVCLFRMRRAPAAAPQQPRFIRSMRVLMMLLALGCVLCIVSAITGIQAFEVELTRIFITYWHGSWRWLALVYAAIFAVAFYGIYRRYPVAWKLGWVFLVGGALDFIVLVWLDAIHQPYGWAFAIAATLGGIGVTVYWGSWWWKQKSYFFPAAKEQT